MFLTVCVDLLTLLCDHQDKCELCLKGCHGLTEEKETEREAGRGSGLTSSRILFTVSPFCRKTRDTKMIILKKTYSHL